MGELTIEENIKMIKGLNKRELLHRFGSIAGYKSVANYRAYFEEMEKIKLEMSMYENEILKRMYGR